ncbi:putative DCC family thiol-disulfide oxidoreductase YuxK [Pontibacter aydingkolensis]|uniref:DUF393 domain-containing protein n=1 Tax=Pontibacter aydingkolensis TaxID=1911536 RepID=A0ABS7CPR9_9BACT|nr:DCC1-like thiol-disulfide oxidoreductase family protein [Pontibacter aydingkolensis]MBW7465820.1 DUF393 domain-containing protein [Pontibacter aydingkolensis]
MQSKVSIVTNGEHQQLPLSTLKPIMVYDGACNFCKYWVSKWQLHASGEVTFIPYQQLPKTYFGITRQQFSKSVYLITQYRRLRGAAAVFEMLALGGNDFWNRLYHNVILADSVFEAGYWLVATFRDFFFWVIKLFSKEAREFDAQQPPPS